ncbi:MAG: hypothetical protein M3069_29440 [Chloroflexota bacterium]|nr:hypothetical protein [Chloroflexota bacterium]
MAFTASQLEDIITWCTDSPQLGLERRQAQRQFFGDDDERPVKYWEGVRDIVSRQRRFVGWFAFDFRLADDRQPAQLAAESLFRAAELVEALDAVRRARFVLAIVTSTDARRTTFLELESEVFEVRNTTWAQLLPRGSAVVAHLVPVRNRYWLAGPGWLQWPIGIGPNMRGDLSKFQFDPIQLERLMQGRASAPDEEPHEQAPQDSTLEEAVARLTSAATEAGRPELIMSVDEWRALVLRHLAGTDPNAYFQDVIARVGPASSLDEANVWLALANNIWNTTPQPDRGGRTAAELSAPWRTPARPH